MEWDLSIYYTGLTDPQIETDINEINKLVEDYTLTNMGKLMGFDSYQIGVLVGKLEGIITRIADLNTFPGLVVSADQTNKEAIALHSKLTNHRTEWLKQLTPLELELVNTLKERPELVEQLPNWKYYLTRLKIQSNHKLSEAEEIMELDKNRSGVDEWEKLQSELVSTTKYVIKIEGQIQKLSWSEGAALRSHKDHIVRKAAIDGLFGGLEEISDIVSFSLRNICTNHVTNSKKRKYTSFKGSSYHSSHLSEPIISAMFEVILENVKIFQEFLLLKAKLIGTEKLRGEDLDAPYPFSDDRKIPWEEAKQIVQEGFDSFDPEFGKIAEEMFKDNRVDATPREAKVAGAFCAPNYSSKRSSILMSYSGTMDNVSTLAHEMGHAVHGEYIFRNQSFFNSQIGMPIAETASEFGSLLFNLKFENEAETETQKKAILFNMVENFMITIFEVASRTLFEQSLYETIDRNEYLSKEKINEIYWVARGRVFGDVVNWVPNQVYEWVWKPHYFIPNLRFYNYPYVFGELSVLGMYAEYRKDNVEFVKKFKEFLSTGSSEHPQDFMRKLFGFNLSSKEFWQNGMDELNVLLVECKKYIS